MTDDLRTQGCLVYRVRLHFPAGHLPDYEYIIRARTEGDAVFGAFKVASHKACPACEEGLYQVERVEWPLDPDADRGEALGAVKQEDAQQKALQRHRLDEQSH